MNKKRTFFISLIFLVTIACVVPGLSSTPPTPIFAPTVDTGAIEMRVAGTVSAALAQTEQAQPTVTSTFPATPPPISTTPAPTGTPTATANPSQSTLTQQADGSTLFVDERAGYKVTVPAEWLAVRVDEQEYLDAFSLAGSRQCKYSTVPAECSRRKPEYLPPACHRYTAVAYSKRFCQRHALCFG